MRYKAYGPFEIPKSGSREGQWRSTFWTNVEDENHVHEGLGNAIGCYVFSLRFRENVLPWYVGKTENVSGFSGECFTDHKIEIYDKVIEAQRGAPELFLLARLDGRSHFSRPRANAVSDIDWLETMLILWALDKNPVLENNKKTSMFRKMNVDGLLTGGRRIHKRGRPSQAAAKIRSMLFSD